MALKKGPTSPSRPTVKKLFAVSGNLCAFPGCSTPLYDSESDSIIGEICHIKGERKGSARYDENQSDKDRQGFDNLLLLCKIHHTIVDGDRVAYTFERLIQMKTDHQARHRSPPPFDNATVERFVTQAKTKGKKKKKKKKKK